MRTKRIIRTTRRSMSVQQLKRQRDSDRKTKWKEIKKREDLLKHQHPWPRVVYAWEKSFVVIKPPGSPEYAYFECFLMAAPLK